mmetsp:Transcript_8715/g.18721  ORF Transcript_8715/g.18721 Transcript_8715/m.18721 type:complete len:202 (-) Transcript_8715:265-870(-)
MEWQVELISEMAKVLLASPTDTSILAFQIARRRLEAALLTLMAREARCAEASLVLSGRADTVVDAKSQLLLHPLYRITEGRRFVLAEFTSVRCLSLMCVRAITVMLLGPVLHGCLGALAAIVAKERIVSFAVAAFLNLDITPKTGVALGAYAVHQIVMPAQIFEYTFNATGIIGIEGLFSLISMLAIILETVLALASVVAF